MRGACILLLTVAALAGCRRKAAEPSADYERAAVLYQQLYASQLDDAYGDPKMEEVAAGLRKVDPRSADAPAARDLLGIIERGRDEFAKSRERRRQMEAVSAADLKKTSNIDPQAILASHASPDAGQQDPTGPGASIADLNRETGGCLIAYQPFREQGTGTTGQLYKLAPSSPCREKLPGFVGQAALVVDGKIYRRIPEPEAAPAGGAKDAGPDGGVADAGERPTQKAAVAPSVPEGAQLVSTDPDGTRHYQVPSLSYIPGMPTGEAAPSAASERRPASDALPDATPHPIPGDQTGASSR